MSVRKIACFAHTPNIAAQKLCTASSVSEWAGRIRAMVVWLKRSSLAKPVLRGVCRIWDPRKDEIIRLSCILHDCMSGMVSINCLSSLVRAVNSVVFGLVFGNSDASQYCSACRLSLCRHWQAHVFSEKKFSGLSFRPGSLVKIICQRCAGFMD